MPDSIGGKVTTLAPLVREITPSVVNISVHGRVKEDNPLYRDPSFREFLDGPHGPEQEVQAVGSGVVVDAQNGYVLTANHVVAKVSTAQVTTKDGRRFLAKLVGRDPGTDLAVLRLQDAQAVKAIPMGDSDRLEVGDFVIAVGNPFGLGQTVTSGLVSALGRTGLAKQGYEDFIQTDAAINPGNSGGALVNLRGQLVGINTAIFSPAGGNVGIGFAVPINMARRVHAADRSTCAAFGVDTSVSRQRILRWPSEHHRRRWKAPLSPVSAAARPQNVAESKKETSLSLLMECISAGPLVYAISSASRPWVSAFS